MHLEYEDSTITLTTKEGRIYEYKGVSQKDFEKAKEEETLKHLGEKTKVKGALTEEEIAQLHNKFIVERECNIMGVPFVIKNLTFSEEIDFLEVYNDFDKRTLQDEYNNKVSKEKLKKCLISFNGNYVKDEQIENFSAEKINYMLGEYRELATDIAGYLSEFDEKELVDKEVEEFILTDKIIRTERLKGEPDLTFRYKILNVSEYEKVAKAASEAIPGQVSNIYAKAIKDREYAKELIIETPEDIELLGVELVRFILSRANSLQNQIVELLSDSKELGGRLKN